MQIRKREVSVKFTKTEERQFKTVVDLLSELARETDDKTAQDALGGVLDVLTKYGSEDLKAALAGGSKTKE